MSFKDKLIGKIPGAFAQAFDLRDREETEMTPSSDETDMESDEIRELSEGPVAAKISQGLKQRIRAPWSKALVVKVYGRTGLQLSPCKNSCFMEAGRKNRLH